MKVVIVAHCARRTQADQLVSDRNANVVMDEIGRSAIWGYRKALEWATQHNERVVVIEDDAVPVKRFRNKADH